MTWRPDYATLAEGRDHLRITDAADTAEDAEIAVAITAASRLVDTFAGRQFGSTTATARYYTARRDRMGRSVVTIDDLMSVTSLVVKNSTTYGGTYDVTVSTYTLEPLNAIANGKPWDLLYVPGGLPTHVNGVEITALWGWTAVPAAIKQATLLQMARLIKRRSAPFGVAGSPDMGNELRLLSKLDPDVQVLVNAYRRWW